MIRFRPPLITSLLLLPALAPPASAQVAPDQEAAYQRYLFDTPRLRTVLTHT